MTVKMRRMYNPAIGDYEESVGEATLITLDGVGYPTIQAAMNAAVAGSIILVAPGTYQEDVTWSDASGVQLLPKIPGTVVIEAVTAFAVSINPAAAAGTWSATLGVELSHGDGLTGLLINNTNVGKRMNIYLQDVEIESEEPTDKAISVLRAGASDNAIRIYAASGRLSTIEGLVNFITESTDDRVRFHGYRLVGGFTCVGAVANELAFTCCGIKTGGLTVDGANVYNLLACWYETDANPNVHTACVDVVEQ